MRVAAYGTGGVSAAVATGTKVEDIVLATDIPATSLLLQCEQMPRLSFWFEQTVGAIGANVVLEYGIRSDGPPNGAFRFRTLTPPFVLAPGVAGPPIEITFPAVVVRVTFTRPAGQATNVRYVLGCAA